MSEIDYSEQFSIDDFEEGKVFAMLCYLPMCCCIGLLGVVLAFVQKNNDFHCFHARQGLGIGILYLIFTILFVIAQFLVSLLGLGLLSLLFYFLYGLATMALFGLGVFGIYQCTQPEYKALPLIGDKLVEWFAFIAKDEPKA